MPNDDADDDDGVFKLSQPEMCIRDRYVIDFSRVDPDDLMIATIQAAGGVDDFLMVLFDEMVVP